MKRTVSFCPADSQWRTGWCARILTCAVLALLLVLLTAGDDRKEVQRVSEAFKSILDARWSKLSVPKSPPSDRPGVSWSWRLSPPFPSEWPPRKESRFIYYAFAEGFDLNIMDGVRIGALWAKLEVPVSGDTPPVLTSLLDAVKELGVQGVRPLSAEEMAKSGGSEPIESALGDLMAHPDQACDTRERISAYYCFWSRNNGVISEAIRPRHEKFFDWLKCQ